MHENRRYVKLTQIGLATASALAFAPAARAELVASTHESAALAVSRSGTPVVAYVDGCALSVARRTAAGWRSALASTCLPLGSRGIVLAGAVVDPQGRISVLARDRNGTRLALVRQTRAGFRQQTVVRAARGSALGEPGIALDARGRPAVAYAVRRPSQATFLRLVRIDPRGQLVTIAITRRGFPFSSLPPSASPVLVRGRLHVVEAFNTEAIEWSLERDGWLGQFLFASIRGQGVGPVFAAAVGDATWTAATLLQPEFGESDVLLTERTDTETTSIVFTHALVSALAIAGGSPEVAANEAVPVADGAVTAALVADAAGSATELDGAIAGYAVDAHGARHILLSTERGLEWFSSPVRPALQVELEADANGALRGRVVGATAGTVDLYRERPGSARVLVATVPLADDGAFAAQDQPPASPTLYRAVYRDPATALPYASLTRAPDG